MRFRGLGLGFLFLMVAACGSATTRPAPPPILTPAPTVFPPPLDAWVEAPPLEALLANRNDAAFSWSAEAEVVSLHRGESLTITFNRAVASELEVGRPLPEVPLELTPDVPGIATFVTAHRLTFTPDERVMTRGLEVRYRPKPSLTSRAGQVLGETRTFTLVLDGTPRMLAHENEAGRGRPLRFYFDAPITASAITREALLYEVGGGMRTFAFRARSLPRRPRGDYPLEIVPSRAIDPGTELGFAVAPRWVGGGSRPGVRFVSIEPLPHLLVDPEPMSEGDFEESGERDYDAHMDLTPRDALGVFRVGDALRLRATHPLAQPALTSFAFVPPVEGLAVRLEQEGRVLAIEGELEGGRTYTLRITDLATTTGMALAPTRLVTLRREPPEPSADFLAQGTVCERDTPCLLDIRATNVPRGTVTWLGIDRDGIVAALADTAFNGRTLRGAPMREHLTTGTSIFREARGRVPTLAEGAFGLGVVRLQASPETHPANRFVQRTDLATTAIALEETLVTWVTSLSGAAPLTGVNVRAVSGPGPAPSGVTDARGLVELAHVTSESGRGVRTTVVASRGDDTSAVALHSYATRTHAAEGRRVAMLTDRGIYRPGEQVRVVAYVRDVNGASGRVAQPFRARFRLVSEYSGETLATADATVSSGGRYAAALAVPLHTMRSTCRIDLVQVETSATVASVTARVATFDTPRSVVDLTAETATSVAGSPFLLGVHARQLVGTPLAGAQTRVVLRRLREAERPARFDRFSFGPAERDVFPRTEHEGATTLDAEGHARVELPFPADLVVRTAYRADVIVRDAIGEDTAGSVGFIGMPATHEVGLALDQTYITMGEDIRAEVVALDAAAALVSGKRVEVRVKELSGRIYYEQVRGARGGSLVERRTDTDRVVHTCNAVTQEGIGRCGFAPVRAGLYRVEASLRDEQGRTSLAQVDVYVAGPVTEESAGFDDSIRLHLDKGSAVGGDVVEAIFASPYEDAEMLLLVTTTRLVHAERKRVPAGPQSVRFTVTDAMVPGARVSVVLAKPRSAAYRAPLDLGAPSVRMGTATLAVRPAATALTVEVAGLAERVRANDGVDVTVRVRDAGGQGVRGHVVLYAVDEAVLRLTSYRTPQPANAFFVPTTPALHFADLRDSLIRPSLDALVATGSGDGDDATSPGDEPVPSRERFDPTLVFLTDIETDASGQARVRLPASGRATEFRVMAVAVDDALRSGIGTATLRATSRVAMRPLFPVVLTVGDEASIEALVTNTGTEPVRAEATFTLAGETHTQSITLGVRESRVVAQPFRATSRGAVPMKLVVRGGGDTLEHEAPVIVRDEDVGLRRSISGAFLGQHAIDIALPEHIESGSIVLHVRRGRFVGHRTLLERLRNTVPPRSPIGLATRLHMLTRLRESADVGYTPEERAYMDLAIREHVESVRALRSHAGGFGTNASGVDSLAITAAVYFALEDVGVAAGLHASEMAQMKAHVKRLAGEEAGYEGLDANEQARLLARLAAADMRQDERIRASYTQRSLLSPASQARLALAFGEDDGRRATLIENAMKNVDMTRTTYAELPPDFLLALLPLAEAHAPITAYVPRIEASIAAIVDRGQVDDSPLSMETFDVVMRLDRRETEGVAVRATLDGRSLGPTSATERAVILRFDARQLAGRHRLVLTAVADATHTFELSGTYVERGDASRSIGRRFFVMRRFETLDGRVLADGTALPRNAPVRVRAFLVVESPVYERVSVRIPDFGGFTARNERTSMQTEIETILGAPIVDGVTDPRTAIAEHTAGYVTERNVNAGSNVFTFETLPAGLFEVTYVVRAMLPGKFVAPPATFVGPDGQTWARSSVARMEVSR